MKRMWSRNELAKQVKEVKKDITTLVDAQGHERFVEGNISSEIEGVSFAYGKWSLSGTHLMIVVAGVIAANTTIARNSVICNINVPKWIKDKIYAIKGTGVAWVVFKVIDATWSSHDSDILLNKPEADILRLEQDTALTCETETNFRYSFDLLIDNA